jgi:concanavalin A-like lectin/glucanase superfamily protein/fibronectin type III domain protein
VRRTLLCSSLFFLLAGSAQAATINVAPGGNLSTAYNGAQSGDVLELASGSYGDWATPSGSKQVTVRAAAGAKPVFRTLRANAANMTFQGIEVDAGFAKPVGAAVELSAPNVTFKGGAIGNVTNEKGVLSGSGAVGAIFDGVYFHDVRVTDSAVHNECLYSQTPGLTVRNSRFHACATFDLFVTRGDWWGQALYGDLVLENNVFEHATNIGADTWHYYSLAPNNGVIRQMRNWRVVNNTFETAVGGGSYPDGASGIWANNVGSWPCAAGMTYRNNVGTACHSSDKAVSPASSCGQPACASPRTAALGWVNPGAGDFHLTGSSPAIDAADPAYAPATDKDGRSRNGRPDAGAYEYGGVVTAPAPEPTPTPTPTPTPIPTPTPTPVPTPSPDTQAPSVPQGMAWTTITQTGIGVRWNAASDNRGVTGYRVYRNNALVGTTSDTGYTVSGLQCGTSYTIGLTAIDAAGNESNRAEATGTTTTSACTAPAPTPPSTSGLVGAWSFNEATGTTVADKSGRGNTGTIAGATRTTAGKTGGALSFDGVNDYVSVPDSATLDLTKGMTIEAWVYPTSLSGARTVVFKENRAARHQSYSVYAQPAAEVATGSTYTTQTGSQALTLNAWNHVAATYDGTTLRVFRNGAQIGSRALSGSLVNTGDPLKFGGNAVWSEWFKGRIDEVRVFNVARTAAEITADMNAAI